MEISVILIQKEKRKKGKAQGKAQDSKQKKKRKEKEGKKKTPCRIRTPALSLRSVFLRLTPLGHQRAAV